MTFLRKRLDHLFNILFKPIPGTYQKIAEDANGKLGESIIWLIILGPIMEISARNEFNILRITISMFSVPLLILIFSNFLQLSLHKIFHRKKYLYDELLYASTLIFVVISLLQSILLFFFKTFWLNIFSIYGIILIIIAIKTYTNLKTWQAIVSTLISSILTVLAALCVLIFIMLLIGTVPQIF